MEPSRNPTQGAKVTDYTAESTEGAGPVASDSLAAESTTFAENRGSEPLGVKGQNSTFANEDTSAAETLDPAQNAEMRDNEGEEKYTRAPVSGTRDTSGELSAGSHAHTGNRATEADSGYGEGATGTHNSESGVAPSYVNAQFVDDSGPKGRNLTEGGFSNDESKRAEFDADLPAGTTPGFKGNSSSGKVATDEGAYGSLDRDEEV